jgi:hypothetical protein
MAGSQLFTGFTLGKETVAGTAVPTVRMFFPDGTGMFDEDIQLTLHEDANRGTRTNITHATSQGVAVELPFRSASDTGLAFDELPVYFSQFAGGQTGTGGTAAKVWDFVPSQTASNAQESYTLEAYDDVQAWEFEYGHIRRLRISASIDGLTQVEADWFARQATKTTKTSVSANNGVKVVGKHWTLRHATANSGLDAATSVPSSLIGFDLDLATGLVPRWYMSGNLYFENVQESEHLGGTLSMQVASTDDAVTQYYDKWKAGTVDFVRLRNNGASLGSTTYAAEIDLAVLYTKVEPISEEQDGVNFYQVEAAVVYDSTWANSFSAHVIASIDTLP